MQSALPSLYVIFGESERHILLQGSLTCVLKGRRIDFSGFARLRKQKGFQFNLIWTFFSKTNPDPWSLSLGGAVS
jgi:hypothetical protein